MMFMWPTWTAMATSTSFRRRAMTTPLPGTRTMARLIPPGPPPTSPPALTVLTMCTSPTWTVTAISTSSRHQPTTAPSPGTRTMARPIPLGPPPISPPVRTAPSMCTSPTWTATAISISFLPRCPTTPSPGTRTTALLIPPGPPPISPPTLTQPRKYTSPTWTETAISTSSRRQPTTHHRLVRERWRG